MNSTKNAVRSLGAAGSVALTMALAACGGGGSTGTAAAVTPAPAPSTPSAVMPTLVTAKSCTNVNGDLDVLQTALTTQLRPALLAIPTVGAPAASATTALVKTLDAVDAITSALTALASTQNTQAFTTQLSGAGDSILCSGSSLSDSLALISSSQTLPVPGLAQVQQTLASVTQQVANGLVGTTPGGDLTALTSQLVLLANQVRDLSTGLPAQFNQPFLTDLLKLNATAFNSLALILGDLGALNGNKLATDVTALLTAGATGLPLSLATQFGVPASALTPVTTQFTAAAQAVGGGLGLIAGPTLQAVSVVLGGVNGTPLGSATAAFSDLLEGGLSTTSGLVTVASTTRVGQLTTLLGGNGITTLAQSLLTSFGGLLPPKP